MNFSHTILKEKKKKNRKKNPTQKQSSNLIQAF